MSWGGRFTSFIEMFESEHPLRSVCCCALLQTSGARREPGGARLVRGDGRCLARGGTVPPFTNVLDSCLCTLYVEKEVHRCDTTKQVLF